MVSQLTAEYISVLKELLILSKNDSYKKINLSDAFVNAGIPEENHYAITQYLHDNDYIEMVSIGGKVSITNKTIELINSHNNYTNKRKNFELVLDTIKFFKPKPQNAIAGMLVITGIGYFSTSWVNQIINASIEFLFGFKVKSDNDPYIGFSLIFLGLSFWVVAHIINRQKPN